MRPSRASVCSSMTGVPGGTSGSGRGSGGAPGSAAERFRVMTVIPGAFRTDLGSNRRSARDSIADYAAQNAARRARLAALSGHQRGDPARAAQAIVMAVNTAPPPRRLVLGVDAADSVAADLMAFGEEMRQWESVSRATDFLQN